MVDITQFRIGEDISFTFRPKTRTRQPLVGATAADMSFVISATPGGTRLYDFGGATYFDVLDTTSLETTVTIPAAAIPALAASTAYRFDMWTDYEARLWQEGGKFQLAPTTLPA